MNKISTNLPVKLEELCQFTFNFKNLIKIIDFLHQNNLCLQQNLKDIDKRLLTVESFKDDIEDLKIKTINLENTNENLNRSFSNLQENIIKFDSRIHEIETKTNDIESKIRTSEIILNENVQNVNSLNKVVDENKRFSNQLNDLINKNSQNITNISEKIDENEKNNKTKFENINNNIKEIKLQYNDQNNELRNINNNISEINETIRNMMNNFDKKYSDINSRFLNVINDIADIHNNIMNNGNYTINEKKEKEGNVNDTNVNGNDNNNNKNSNLFKIAIDEIEENKIKFNKLKEDYEIFKDNTKKENKFFKLNINEISKQYNNLKKIVEQNVGAIENLENNYNNYINSKKEEKKKIVIEEKFKNIDINNLKNYFDNFVPMDAYHKLSDNVRILTSSLNSKAGIEEINTQLKKFNERLETIEMLQQGLTHGPKTRINLGLVNIPHISKNNKNETKNVLNNINDVDNNPNIEKKINDNIINIINKEIDNIDFSLNSKIYDLIFNSSKNTEDINRINKSIEDIRNILISNPGQNDFTKIKNDMEILEEGIKVCKIKIIEIKKDINGIEDEAPNEENKDEVLNGSIKERINYLNTISKNMDSKIISLENKNKSLTKEIKDEVKQNLKNETVKIMQQFKIRLEGFTNRFENELRFKIDQIGLNDFENKINSKLNVDLKEKLDKNDLKKNNYMIKKKIDNLESKISKTFVDTLIDIQMDEQPLITKNNGNGVDICASCNQPKPKNTIFETGTTHAEYFPKTVKNIKRVNKLNKSLINFNPSSKKNANTNNERSFNLNLSIGQNKLPDIIPSLHPK